MLEQEIMQGENAKLKAKKNLGTLIKIMISKINYKLTQNTRIKKWER